MHFFHRLFATIKADGGRVSLEISACAIPLDGVAPFRNAPDEFSFRFGRSFWQTNSDGFVSGRFEIAKIYQTRQSRGPQASDGTATRIERKMRAGSFVEPTRRHHPCIIAIE